MLYEVITMLVMGVGVGVCLGGVPVHVAMALAVEEKHPREHDGGGPPEFFRRVLAQQEHGGNRPDKGA